MDAITSADSIVKKANMRVVEGIPFLKLQGSYDEMGLQYGVLLKTQLLEIHSKMIPLYPKLESSTMFKLIKEKLPTKYRDFLLGAAQGSGIVYDDLLADSFYETIHTGCSSVLVRINTDKGTHLYHAKNRDASNGGTYQAVVEFHPDSGLRYLITQTIGAIFIHQGINEKGISITGNAAPPSDYQPKQFFDDDVYRVLLESADSLKKVDQMIDNYRSDYDEIITVASGPENNGAIYDLSHIKRIKHELATNNQLYVTNHFLDNSLSPSGTFFSHLRYQTIADYLEHHHIVSVNDLIALLSLDNVNNTATVHSIIFNPKQKILYMSFAPHFAASNQWLKYDWNQDQVELIK